MKLKRILIIFLVLMMLSLTVLQAFAGSINDLKKEESEIQNKIDENSSELKSVRAEANEVSKQIQELDKQVNEATLELQKVTDELEQLNLDIIRTTEELEEAEKELEIKNEEFKARLRSMYKNGNTGYIELLLSAENVSELLSRNQMVQQIASYDRDLITFIKEQRDLIEEKKSELESQKASAEVVKSQIEKRKTELETATKEKQSFMASLQEDIDAFEKQHDELSRESEAIKDRIVTLQRAAAVEAAKAKSAKEASQSKSSNSNASSPSRGNSSGTSTPTGGAYSWPVPGHGRISSPYGYRIHPIFNVNRMHTGVDISAPSGTPIVAVNSGVVIHSGWQGGYGMTVIVDHGGGMATLYAHNSANTVSVGQQVSRGQTIALMGSTGNSTGPHLHFEVRKNGDHIDPLPYIR